MVKRFIILLTFSLFISSISNVYAIPQEKGSLAKIVGKKAKADTSEKSQKGSLKSITEKNLQTKKQPSSQQSIKPKILAEKSKTLEIPRTEPKESSNLLYIIIGALTLVVIVLIMRRGGKEATSISDQNDVTVDSETTIEDSESNHEDDEDDSSDEDKKTEKKKKNNPSGWDKPLGEDWRVPPPEDTDDDYVKEKKLNISMENYYVYYVRNNAVFRAQPEYVDFDQDPHLKDNPEYKNNCETINAMMVADNVKMKKGLFYFIDDNGDVCSTNREDVYEKWNDWQEQNAVYDKKVEYESQQAFEDEKIEKRLELRKNIIELLKNTTDKYTASDIDARLKSFDVDLVKKICEQLYHDGTINRTGNYRYYLFSEDIITNENDEEE